MDLSFSVVIPSYNGKEFLRKTFLALRKSTAQPIRYIVVDDFSSDGTSEMVEKEFPEIEIIRNEKNIGPTASRNRGAKLAEGKYIVFLDDDVLVKLDAIQKIIDFAENHSDAGVVGGRLLDENDEETRRNFGQVKLIGTFWVREAFFLTPKILFEKIGGLDEGFFMFFEGPDLSERLSRAGYKTYFCDAAKAIILENHTHFKLWREFMFNLSWLKFHLKHLF